MPSLRALPGILLLLLPAACTGATETPDGVGYVLLDGAARRAAHLEGPDFRASPVLPLALDVSEPLTFTSAAARERIDLQPGMLAHVLGADGTIEWLTLGSEIRADRILVHAEARAARELGERLAAEVTPRGDGLWNLTAPDLFDRTSFLEPPDGVLEVLPDWRLDLAPSAAGDGGSPSDAIVGPAEIAVDSSDAPVAAQREAALVGLYGAGRTTLLLDASGGFTLADRCTGEVSRRGVFRAVGDRVILQSVGTPPLVLARDGESLLHPGGAVLAPWAFEGNLNGRGEP